MKRGSLGANLSSFPFTGSCLRVSISFSFPSSQNIYDDDQDIHDFCSVTRNEGSVLALLTCRQIVIPSTTRDIKK